MDPHLLSFLLTIFFSSRAAHFARVCKFKTYSDEGKLLWWYISGKQRQGGTNSFAANIVQGARGWKENGT